MTPDQEHLLLTVAGVTTGEFSVWQFFRNDEQEMVLKRVSAERAVLQARSLSESVGGRIGTTCRIIITDRDDCCCFEWLHGIGVVFPPPPTVGEADLG